VRGGEAAARSPTLTGSWYTRSATRSSVTQGLLTWRPLHLKFAVVTSRPQSDRLPVHRFIHTRYVSHQVLLSPAFTLKPESSAGVRARRTPFVGSSPAAGPAAGAGSLPGSAPKCSTSRATRSSVPPPSFRP